MYELAYSACDSIPVYCYTYSVCMYWHISTSHSGWGIFLHYYTNIRTLTFVLHVCTIAMDLLNTNVNSVKYMPAANAHTLMHVHTLTLSHTCAHKAHTHVRTCAAVCNAPSLPAPQENLTNPAAYADSTVVTAFKYNITDQPQLIDVLLKAYIGDFLKTLGDTKLVGTSGDVKMCVSHTFCFVRRFPFLDAVPVCTVYVHLFRLCDQWFVFSSICGVCLSVCQGVSSPSSSECKVSGPCGI